MNKPLISVIIAIYNAEKWISRMIDSVLNQSLKDFELLLVDDGSNDGTADILDDYAQKDDRITLLHNNHGESVQLGKQDLTLLMGNILFN